MRPLTFLLLCVLLLTSQTMAVYKTLSTKEVDEAIEFGKKWKNSKKFEEEGLKPYLIQISGIMSADGISKSIRLYTDWTLIAASAVVANRQMRELNPEDIEKIPKTGTLVAIVDVHARGAVPVAKLEKRWVGGNTHLVLKYGEKIVQPRSVESVSDYFKRTWQAIGGVFTPVTGGFPNEERELIFNFIFDLNEQQMNEKASFVLIDADGKQKVVDVDFSRLR